MVDLGRAHRVAEADEEPVVRHALSARDVAEAEVAAEPEGAPAAAGDDRGMAGVLVVVPVVAELVVPKDDRVIEDRPAWWRTDP